MDNNCIATLKDYQTAIKRSFDKVKNNLSKFDNLETSQQNKALRSMTDEQNIIKTNIGLMKMELSNLQEETIKDTWQDTISGLQTQNDALKTEIENRNNIRLSLLDSDDIEINSKDMSITKAFQKGDKILMESGDSIKKMIKTASADKATMQEVNKELQRQNEALQNADKDLSEIDFSLKRAGEQIKAMFRMYATDKLIICLIVIIILAIIAIIIVSFIDFGEKEDTNLLNDVFVQSNKTSTSS